MSVSAHTRGYEDVPYSEMFTEGKEWTLCHFFSRYPFERYDVHAFIDVKVDGEAVVEGIDCKRLKIDVRMSAYGNCPECYGWLDREHVGDWAISPGDDSIDIPEPVAIAEEVYVYEKDRRIYFYRNPGLKTDDNYHVSKCEPYFDLIMDLNKSIGETINGFGLIVTDEVVEINGQKHRRIAPEKSDDGSLDAEWIEGIGSAWGYGMQEEFHTFLVPIPTERQACLYALAQVKDHGTVIYDNTDKLAAMGIIGITTGVERCTVDTQDEDNICYDMLGRILKHPQRGQFYIKNGKKYIKSL
ncbi:MAG: hypothetical protein K2H86_02340 [Muribaculaceae bacterium]|nr:hypothetical protein [Muribaculaceae bacterium]